MQQFNSNIKFITTYLKNEIDSSKVENEIIVKMTINLVNLNNSYDDTWDAVKVALITNQSTVYCLRRYEQFVHHKSYLD
jgi:hypothetical protein